MKKIHFDTEKDGFYGAYWKCAAGSDCAMITMLGDDPEDYMARSAVKISPESRHQRPDHVPCEKRLRPSQLSSRAD